MRITSEGLDKICCPKLGQEKLVKRDERSAAMWVVSEELDKFVTVNLTFTKYVNQKEREAAMWIPSSSKANG